MYFKRVVPKGQAQGRISCDIDGNGVIDRQVGLQRISVQIFNQKSEFADIGCNESGFSWRKTDGGWSTLRTREASNLQLVSQGACYVSVFFG